MLHCVHIVCTGCVTARYTTEVLMLHFVSCRVFLFFGFTNWPRSFAQCMSSQVFSHDWFFESMSGLLSILTHQGRERKNYLSPVLVRFPQVISLISRFSAQSLPVSLKDITMGEMAAFVRHDHSATSDCLIHSISPSTAQMAWTMVDWSKWEACSRSLLSARGLDRWK